MFAGVKIGARAALVLKCGPHIKKNRARAARGSPRERTLSAAEFRAFFARNSGKRARATPNAFRSPRPAAANATGDAAPLRIRRHSVRRWRSTRRCWHRAAAGGLVWRRALSTRGRAPSARRVGARRPFRAADSAQESAGASQA